MSSFTEAQRLRGRLAMPTDSAPIAIRRVQTSARVIPLSYRSHVRGWHPVRAGHGAIAFESKLEARFLTGLALLPELMSVVSQPITVHYRHDGLRRRYTPDFLVELTTVPLELTAFGFGERTLVEVKPLDHARRDESQLCHRFSAARLAGACAMVLVTDADLPIQVEGVRHDA